MMWSVNVSILQRFIFSTKLEQVEGEPALENQMTVGSADE